MFSTKAPLPASISLAARSRPTETIRLPSPPKTTPSTQFSWWFIRSSSRPLVAWWIRIVLSAQPTASRRSSGETARPNSVS